MATHISPSPSNPLSNHLEDNSYRSCRPLQPPSPRNPNITIEPVTPQTLPSYRRLITLLLPIRYPDSFYKESVATSLETSSFSLIALWHDKPPSSTVTTPSSRVIAGIQARLEPVCSNPNNSSETHTLYIQTLALLAPYRHLGIASSLLSELLLRTLHKDSGLIVESVYAHVWEASAEALEWYVKRGFAVQEGVVHNYYRRLKPGGARIVRRKIGASDYGIGIQCIEGQVMGENPNEGLARPRREVLDADKSPD